MKYKVGDVVKVRSDLNTIKGAIAEMLKFKGKIVHIQEALEKDYFIYEDPEKWSWNDEMLEPLTEEDVKKHFEKYAKSFKDYDIKFEVKKKEPILDEEEKKYLSAVIRPFRDRVKYITKCVYTDNTSYISISTKSIKKNIILEGINLPFFETNIMYKGMKSDKQYTLEELGI